jgi:hypothetical protein
MKRVDFSIASKTSFSVGAVVANVTEFKLKMEKAAEMK